MSVELAPYDPTDLLRTDEDIRAYLTDALNDEDPAVFVIALGDIVRMKGLDAIAEQAGVDIPTLNAALSPPNAPNWKMIHRILKALRIHLEAAA